MNIEFLIVHNINILNKAPIFSDDAIVFAELGSEERENFTNFFGNHIETQRLSNKAKPAKFNKSANIENHAHKSIAEIKNCDIRRAMQITRNLTAKLHQTMKGNSSSDGIILFVKYHNNDTNYLCIMKMDPEKGIRYDREEKILKIIEDMLPDSSRKLHKVSFFDLNKINEDEYTFQVLDKQQSGDEVSNFFLGSFLESTLEFDDRRVSKVFASSHDDLLNLIEHDYGIEDIDILDQVSKDYKALFSISREIQIVDEVSNIVERVVHNDKLSNDISKKWAGKIAETYGDEVYYDFKTEIVKKFNTVYRDEDDRITLQYDADLESKGAVRVDTEENEIVIRIDRTYISKFDKN